MAYIGQPEDEWEAEQRKQAKKRKKRNRPSPKFGHCSACGTRLKSESQVKRHPLVCPARKDK